MQGRGWIRYQRSEGGMGFDVKTPHRPSEKGRLRLRQQGGRREEIRRRRERGERGEREERGDRRKRGGRASNETRMTFRTKFKKLQKVFT